MGLHAFCEQEAGECHHRPVLRAHPGALLQGIGVQQEVDRAGLGSWSSQDRAGCRTGPEMHLPRWRRRSAAYISTAMRSVELSGRLRRANERVSEYQNALPIAGLWGDGTEGPADMMALDASRHLWSARVDPRRRTFAAGLYTHIRDRWSPFHDQPIVLNERQAGVAVAGVEKHNRAEDRIRISLLAVDTHGVTNVAMAIAKLLGFDLCPRLRDLAKTVRAPGLAAAGKPGGRHRASRVGQGDRARLGRPGAPGGVDSGGQGVRGTCHSNR